MIGFGDTLAFADGLLHPLATPAHIVALIGLALVAGRHSWPARAAILLAFAAGLAGGLGAIAWGIGETATADGLLAAAALCGVSAAISVPLRPALVAALALAAGAALGLDSPPDAIALGAAVLTLIGTACGAIAALAVLTVATVRLAAWWNGVPLCVAGSWIAAIAILVLALRWAA